MTTAREIMTADPVILNVSDSARRAGEMMASKGIGAIIVCNDEKRLQGMVTDRDLAVEVLAQGRDADSTTLGDLVDGTEVVTIGADDSVDEAIRTMESHAVRRLPVIDGTTVIGMVSQGDLAESASDREVGDMVESISEAPDNTGRG